MEPRMRLIKMATKEARGLAGELAINSIPTLALSGAAGKLHAMPLCRIIAWAEAAAPH